jgi:hypothetical protein
LLATPVVFFILGLHGISSRDNDGAHISPEALADEVAKRLEKNVFGQATQSRNVLAFYPNWRDFNWKEQLVHANEIEIIVSYWPKWVSNYIDELVEVFDRNGRISIVLPSPHNEEAVKGTQKMFPEHTLESTKREIEKTAAALLLAFDKSNSPRKRLDVFFFSGRLNYAAVRFDRQRLYYGFYEHFRELRISSSACLLDLSNSQVLADFWEKEFTGFAEHSQAASISELREILRSMKPADGPQPDRQLDR